MVIGNIIHILFVLLIATTIIFLILENRNAVKTTAWIIVLIAFPVFGFIVYLLFGMNYRAERNLKKIQKKKESQHESNSLLEISEDCGRIERLAEVVSGFSVKTYNDFKIYTDGKSLFDALKNEIINAQTCISMEYYILENDEIGGEIIELLKNKSKAGVQVRLMVDDLGSWYLKRKTKKEMEDAGISILSCLRVFVPYLTTHLNYRNHRKIAVFDHKIAFMGGMNIADRYVKGVDWGVWRDTHIRLEGEIVADLERIVDEDWYLLGDGEMPNDLSITEVNHSKSLLGKVQIVKSGPDMPVHPIMQLYHKMILSAKREIEIQTPYFMPNECIREALKCAARSGVSVKIMIPLKSDERFVMMGSYSYVDELANAGCEFYFYKRGFLHSKTLMIDKTVVSIGSANLDFRSLEHNFELTSVFYDKDIATMHSEIFAKDLLESEKLNRKRWEERSKFMRIKESVARLFSPLF